MKREDGKRDIQDDTAVSRTFKGIRWQRSRSDVAQIRAPAGLARTTKDPTEVPEGRQRFGKCNRFKLISMLK